MVQNKDTSSYLILVIALVVIIAIGIWTIFSSEPKEKDKRNFQNTEEKEQYLTGKRPSVSGKTSLEEGDKAPDFKLESIEGEFISLKDFKGRKFLLVFFNSGCGYCKVEIKDLVELYGEGKEIVAIAIWGDKKDNLIRFAEEFGISFPILIDENNQIAHKYFIKGTPTNFVVDKNSMIAQKHRGYAPKIELERIFKLVD